MEVLADRAADHYLAEREAREDLMESVLREPVDRAGVHFSDDQSGWVVVEGRGADGWPGVCWGFWKCGVVI